MGLAVDIFVYDQLSDRLSMNDKQKNLITRLPIVRRRKMCRSLSILLRNELTSAVLPLEDNKG